MVRAMYRYEIQFMQNHSLPTSLFRCNIEMEMMQLDAGVLRPRDLQRSVVGAWIRAHTRTTDVQGVKWQRCR